MSEGYTPTKSLAEKTDVLEAYHSYLLINIITQRPVYVGVSRCAIQIHDNLGGDLSLLYETLVHLETIISSSFTKTDIEIMESNIMEVCYSGKVSILYRLMKAEKISTLSMMAFYGCVMDAGHYLTSADKHNQSTLDVMERAEELLLSKAITVKGEGIWKVLRECMIGEKVIGALTKLKKEMAQFKKGDDSDMIHYALYDWILLLERLINSEQLPDEEKSKQLQTGYDKIYKRLVAIIESTKSSDDIIGEDVDGSNFTVMEKDVTAFVANMSDGLYSLTRTIINKHWSSPSCLTYIDTRGDGRYGSKVGRNNGCISALIGYIASVFLSERELVVNDDAHNQVDEGVSIIDKHVITSRHKPAHGEEQDAHLRDTTVPSGCEPLSNVLRDGLAALNNVSQILFANWNGIRPNVATASSHTIKDLNGSAGPTITPLMNFYSDLPHGQNFCSPAKFMSQSSYTIPQLEEISLKFVGLYSVFPELYVSSVSKVALTMAKRTNQPMEVRLAHLQMTLAGSIKGGENAQKVRRMGVKKLGKDKYDKIINHTWVDVFKDAGDNKLVLKNKFKEAVRQLVGDETYANLKTNELHLIYGSIRGSIQTAELRKECSKIIGDESYDKVVKYNWGPKLNELDDNAAREMFHEVVKTLVDDAQYKSLKPTQWNLIYGSIRGGYVTGQLRDEAYTMLADGDVNNLKKNHLSILLNKKIDEEDVTDLLPIALAIQKGEELTEEQSDFLERVDTRWNSWFHYLQVYKTEVFDKHEELFGKGIFHVPSSSNSTITKLEIDTDQYDCTGLNIWLMPQVELFENVNWRSMKDEEVTAKLGWNRKKVLKVSSLWKCILNQRRLRLQEFGVTFNAAKMRNLTQASNENRKKEMRARLKKKKT